MPHPERALTRLPALLLILLLGACASPVSPPADGALAPEQGWSVRGKLGLRDGSRQESLRFLWQLDTPEHYFLRLSAPIGGQQAVIEGRRGVVNARLPDGSQQSAASAEALVANLYGWQAPLASLRWWVRGQPDPQRSLTALPDAEGSRRISQEGWHIHWQQYRRFGAFDLPTRIEIVAPDNGPTLTVIVQDWQWQTPH